MKKIITTLCVAVLAIVALATTRIWVYQNDGTRTPFDVTTVDSISFAEPGVLSVTPLTKDLPNTGGRFTLTVQANKPWTAVVDDPTALTLSKASGVGNATLSCTAVANGDEVPYSATIIFTLEDGATQEVLVTVAALVVEPDQLTLSLTTKSIDADGERFTVTVTSNKAWTVSADQPWVSLSATNGTNNGSFSVVVAPNESETADEATITVTTASGKLSKTVAISREGMVNPNQHDYVDLGLPSGTLWATCNVGATTPEGYGDYFAWGETEPKSYCAWSTYKYGNGYNRLTKYCNKSSYGKNGYTDNKTELDPEDDAATANWGSDWRMPTKAEQDELRAKCQWKWSMYGYRVTGPNGNSLFLPAAGNDDGGSHNGAGSYGLYWSSTLYGSDPSDAYYLRFGSPDVGFTNYYYADRYYGHSVRPVLKR